VLVQEGLASSIADHFHDVRLLQFVVIEGAGVDLITHNLIHIILASMFILELLKPNLILVVSSLFFYE